LPERTGTGGKPCEVSEDTGGGAVAGAPEQGGARGRMGLGTGRGGAGRRDGVATGHGETWRGGVLGEKHVSFIGKKCAFYSFYKNF